jgi:DNA repair exonuclease SbcCD ATPase subunit
MVAEEETRLEDANTNVSSFGRSTGPERKTVGSMAMERSSTHSTLPIGSSYVTTETQLVPDSRQSGVPLDTTETDSPTSSDVARGPKSTSHPIGKSDLKGTMETAPTSGSVREGFPQATVSGLSHNASFYRGQFTSNEIRFGYHGNITPPPSTFRTGSYFSSWTDIHGINDINRLQSLVPASFSEAGDFSSHRLPLPESLKSSLPKQLVSSLSRSLVMAPEECKDLSSDSLKEMVVYLSSLAEEWKKNCCFAAKEFTDPAGSLSQLSSLSSSLHPSQVFSIALENSAGQCGSLSTPPATTATQQSAIPSPPASPALQYETLTRVNSVLKMRCEELDSLVNVIKERVPRLKDTATQTERVSETRGDDGERGGNPSERTNSSLQRKTHASEELSSERTMSQSQFSSLPDSGTSSHLQFEVEKRKMEQTISKLQREIRVLKSEMGTKDMELHESEEESYRLRRSLKLLRTDYETQHHEEMKETMSKVESLQASLDEAQLENRELSRKLSEISVSLESSGEGTRQHIFAEEERHRKEIERTYDSLEQSQKEVRSLEKDKRSLKNELELVSDKLSLLEATKLSNEKLQTNLSQANKDVESLQLQNSFNEHELRKVESQLESEQRERSELESLVDSYRMNLRVAESRKQKLEEDITQLREKFGQLPSPNDVKKLQYERDEAERRAYRVEEEKQMHRSMSEETISHLKEEVERHRRLIQLAEEEKRMVEKRAASEEFHRRRTNSDLDRTVGDLQNSLRHLQAELKKKNEQVQHLSTSQSWSDAKFDKVKRDFESRLSVKQIELEQAKEEIQALKRSRQDRGSFIGKEEMEKRLAESRRVQASLEAKAIQFEERYASLKCEKDVELLYLRQELDEEQKARKSLAERLEVMDKEFAHQLATGKRK